MHASQEHSNALELQEGILTLRCVKILSTVLQESHLKCGEIWSCDSSEIDILGCIIESSESWPLDWILDGPPCMA